MPENILYIILLSAGASFVQRTIGFGFGIFIMTALPFLMPSYGEAVTLSGLLSLTSAAIATFCDACSSLCKVFTSFVFIVVTKWLQSDYII